MKKILVIQNKRIGDVLLASLIGANIKQVYPSAEVHYMVYDYTTGVIKHNPNINKIISINERKLKKIPNLIKLIIQIRKDKYDIIFDPYAKLQSRLICLFSNAKIRVGFKKREKDPPLKFYTHSIPFLKEKSLPCGKSIEDRVHLVTSVFPIEKPIFKPKIYLTASENNYDKLNKYRKPVIMFGVLGSTPQKTMPYNYITQLIDFVTNTYDVYALFNYAPNQKNEAKSIYNNCKYKDKIIFDIYEDSIKGFIQLMNKCNILIANEGGTVHIAKALDKPTFTIFSPYVLKEHWASFEDELKHTSVHLLEEKPDLYTAQSKEERRNIEDNPSILYNLLTPELILPKMKLFLDHQLK